MQSVDEFKKVIGRKNKKKLKFNTSQENSQYLNLKANISPDNLIRYVTFTILYELELRKLFLILYKMYSFNLN